MGEPRTTCMYCGEELWGHDERDGICRSCIGAELDEVADDWAGYHAGLGEPYDDENELEMQTRWLEQGDG